MTGHGLSSRGRRKGVPACADSRHRVCDILCRERELRAEPRTEKLMSMRSWILSPTASLSFLRSRTICLLCAFGLAVLVKAGDAPRNDGPVSSQITIENEKIPLQQALTELGKQA